MSTETRPGTTQGAFDGRSPVVGRVPVPVRETVKAVVRAAATATAPWRPGPDFLVIGSKRGGTTTLYHALVRHPGVAPLVPAVQRIKSPHYFDLHHDRGPAWYRSHFPLRRNGRISGEAAPYLLYNPLAPGRVASEAPQARLVAMLRDPVERAFSHHWDRVKNGVEHLPFPDAIEAEPERLAGEAERLLADPEVPRPRHEHFSYVDRGHYDVQLRRWLSHVPAGALLVLRSEDFYADPAGAFHDVCDFLGLERWTPEEFGRHHAHQDRPKVDPVTREALWPRFAASTHGLADLLGTPPWWDAHGTTRLPERQLLVAGAAA
jgi:hypothetical protein